MDREARLRATPQTILHKTYTGQNQRFLSLYFKSLDESKDLERVKGIEPSYSAWEAAALPLSYTRDGERNPTVRCQCQALQRCLQAAPASGQAEVFGEFQPLRLVVGAEA